MPAFLSEADTLVEICTCCRKAKRIRTALALITRRGLNLIEEFLEQLLARGGEIQLLVGTDMGTDPEAISALLKLQKRYAGRMTIRRFASGSNQIFHPKVWILFGRALKRERKSQPAFGAIHLPLRAGSPSGRDNRGCTQPSGNMAGRLRSLRTYGKPNAWWIRMLVAARKRPASCRRLDVTVLKSLVRAISFESSIMRCAHEKGADPIEPRGAKSKRCAPRPYRLNTSVGV